MNWGIERNAIIVRKFPKGRGSGVQSVFRQYPIEVRAIRQNNSYQPVGVSLVTVIDADNFTVKERHQELDRRLVERQMAPRETHDKIAILVPKRNIETWVHFLQGEDVNEDDLYRKLERESDCQKDVENFAALPPNSALRTKAPESLQIAVTEMARLV
jgi:hypothetical protein